MTEDDGARTKKGDPVHAFCLEQARAAGAGSPAPNRAAKVGTPPKTVGLTATRPGRCPICLRLFAVGTPIGKCVDGQWAHASCSGAQQVAARNKAQILAGETYRTHQKSTWRRGSSPGSSRRKT